MNEQPSEDSRSQESGRDSSDRHAPRQGTGKGLAIVGSALAVWCAVMVYGIIRSPENSSWVKPAIMFSVFAVFGLLWLAMLWMRSRKTES